MMVIVSWPELEVPTHVIFLVMMSPCAVFLNVPLNASVPDDLAAVIMQVNGLIG